jgi:hypothetical protein
MARTVAQWHTILINAKASESALSGLTSTSAVAIWRLMLYVVAVAMNVLDNLFDLFKADVLGLLATKKAHTLKWYVMLWCRLWTKVC